MNTNTHEHDWRIDPFNIFASIPPKKRIVCTVCGAVTSAVAPHGFTVEPNDDITTWERYAPPARDQPPA